MEQSKPESSMSTPHTRSGSTSDPLLFNLLKDSLRQAPRRQSSYWAPYSARHPVYWAPYHTNAPKLVVPLVEPTTTQIVNHPDSHFAEFPKVSDQRPNKEMDPKVVMESELPSPNPKPPEKSPVLLHNDTLDVSNPRVKKRHKQQLEKMMQSESSAPRPIVPFANPFADPASLPPLPFSRPSTSNVTTTPLTAKDLHPETVNPFIDPPLPPPDAAYLKPAKLQSNNPFADPEPPNMPWPSSIAPAIPPRNPRRVARPHAVIPRDVVPVTNLPAAAPLHRPPPIDTKTNPSTKHSSTSAKSWLSCEETCVHISSTTSTSTAQPSPSSETITNPFSSSTPRLSPKPAPAMHSDLQTPTQMHDSAKNRTKKAGASYALDKQIHAQAQAQKQERKLQEARSQHRHNLARHSLLTPVSQASNSTPSILRSYTFYISLLLMQLGIVSTGAAFAVLVRDKKVGEDITIGTGTAFWLMCSMVAFLAGAFLCVVAVLRRRVRGRPRWVGYLGLDEVVASPSPSPDGQDGTRDVEQGQGAGDLARRSNSSRVPRPERTVSSEGHREGGESILSASTQTQFRNTVWIALYQQPEHLKEYILRLENSVRNCELLNLENSDIGVQPLVPTPLGSGEGIAQPESPSQTAVSLASEGGGGVRGRREQCDSILASQSASMLPLPRLRSNVRVPAKGFVDIDLAGETLVANQSPRESQYSNTSDTASLSLGTEISPYSPLEDLARDLNERQVLEMGANERSVYIAQRRVRSEERGRRVRLSLEGPKSRNGGLLERRLTVERQGKREIRVGDEVGLGGEVEVEMVHLNGDGRARSSSSGRSEGWKSSGDGNGNEEKNGVRDVKTIGRGRETRAGSNVERLKKMWEAVDECFDDNDNGNGAARYAREKVGIKGRRNLKHITLSDELRLESL